MHLYFFQLFLLPNAPELAIIFTIVLILFGPGKLPDVCRSLGDGVRQFKNATRDGLSGPGDETIEASARPAPKTE